MDILGFSELVSSGSFAKNARRYRTILEQIVGLDRVSDSLNYVTFSDTIVLTTGDQHKDLLELLQVTGELTFQLLCDLGWPVRGAISFGPLIRIPSGRRTDLMVAGEAIVDAYHYETNQDWVGVMLTPKLVENLGTQGADFFCLSVIKHYAHIPFKAEPSGEYEGYVVCPITTNSQSNFSTEEIFSRSPELAGTVWTNEIHPALRNRFAPKLKELKALAPDPRSQRKYTKTLAWIESLEPNALLVIAQLKKDGCCALRKAAVR